MSINKNSFVGIRKMNSLQQLMGKLPFKRFEKCFHNYYAVRMFKFNYFKSSTDSLQFLLVDCTV